MSATLRSSLATTIVALMLFPAPGVEAQAHGGDARTLRVSPTGPYTTIAEAVAEAAPGDTVRVATGVYRESVLVDRPLTLLGDGAPVIDGGGEGHVIEATAPITLRGFTIQNSGSRVETEDAGIMVRGARAIIDRNEIVDTAYGIYLKEAPRSEVTRNRVKGRPLPPPRRGDGIRLWQSPGSQVSENRIERSRDVVIYFSDSLLVADNEVVDSRYGLHYMYSNSNRIVGNRFERNEVAAFLMYSRDVELESNVLVDSRGATGIGLGLKDADAITARGNVIASNAAGIHLDNSPSDARLENVFTDNVVVLNAVGVRILPSVTGNRFEGNDFVANDRPAEAAGGVRDGFADQNLFAGNHWSSYAGFDSDADGVGDTPFVRARLADEILTRHPALASLAGSPALDLLDALTRFFPLLAPTPVVVDAFPLTDPADSATPARTADQPAANAAAVGLWLTLTLVAAGSVAVARGERRQIAPRGQS